jgi:predicted nucleotide-binding protein
MEPGTVQKEDYYHYTKFPPEVLMEACDQFLKRLKGAFLGSPGRKRSVQRGWQTWEFDDDSEFSAEYRKADVLVARYAVYDANGSFVVSYTDKHTYVSVGLSTREQIESVYEILNAAAPRYTLSREEREKELHKSVVIFIGHGHSPQWRDLKDHLHEKHGFAVEAYETGARAGYTIVEVLKSLAQKAGFALLVLTAEDADSTGKLHARENAIHETGLLQGRLGFARAIVLVEDGCEQFSNIAGLQQIRFSRGNIKETFGEVLATLRREFGGEKVH